MADRTPRPASAETEARATARPCERVLVTRRLTMRPPLEVDLDAIADGLGDLEVARWIGTVPHPYTAADAREWLERMERAPEDRRWTLHDARGLVGVVSIRAPRSSGAAGKGGEHVLGYWLARRAWGRGLMTEAATAALARHFRRSDAAVAATARTANRASLRVLERLGFERTGTGEEHVLALGEVVPTFTLRLSRTAFERARARRHAS